MNWLRRLHEHHAGGVFACRRARCIRTFFATALLRILFCGKVWYDKENYPPGGVYVFDC